MKELKRIKEKTESYLGGEQNIYSNFKRLEQADAFREAAISAGIAELLLLRCTEDVKKQI